MHRLVRKFVISDTYGNREQFDQALRRAISAVYRCADASLSQQRESIHNPPWDCSSRLRMILPHAISVLEEASQWGCLGDDVKSLTEVIYVSRFTNRASRSIG